MKSLPILVILLLLTRTARCDDPNPQDDGRWTFQMKLDGLKIPNLEAKTMGGRQFWGDRKFCHGYRIQFNTLTGHHRLLDPTDVRQAYGTFEECDARLALICEDKQLKAMSGKAVILIHGIIRSSKSMTTLKKELEEDDYLVVGFDYPSTQVPMAESTNYLNEVIESLEGIEEIHLVCHSMGGLLVRSYLQKTGEDRDPRITKMVMIGTPNLGAEMANAVQNNWLFKQIFGPAGQELVKDPQGTIASLPTPDFDFAIIAGARGTKDGWNPLVPGDDDGTVSVESAQLPGAKDFMTVSALHSFIVDDEAAIAAVKRFLATGSFRETGVCFPIRAPEADISAGL